MLLSMSCCHLKSLLPPTIHPPWPLHPPPPPTPRRARCTRAAPAASRRAPSCTAPLRPGRPTASGPSPCPVSAPLASLTAALSHNVSACLPASPHSPHPHPLTTAAAAPPPPRAPHCAEDEEVECIAAGSSFCAVATSRRHLRLFSQAGTQVRVRLHAGSVSGGGRNESALWHHRHQIPLCKLSARLPACAAAPTAPACRRT